MWERLKRLWLGVEAPSPALPDEHRPYMCTETAFICKMYEDGVAVEKIAERFSRSPQSIRSKVYTMGVRRSKSHISKVRSMARRGG